MLGLQGDVIIVGCTKVISPPKYLESCADWGGGGGCFNNKLSRFLKPLDVL
jgi:hypothetical protein